MNLEWIDKGWARYVRTERSCRIKLIALCLLPWVVLFAWAYLS